MSSSAIARDLLAGYLSSKNIQMIERMKKRSYQNIHGYSYFWRTYEQREIDLIEERNGEIFPYEFKWSTRNI